MEKSTIIAVSLYIIVNYRIRKPIEFLAMNIGLRKKWEIAKNGHG